MPWEIVNDYLVYWNSSQKYGVLHVYHGTSNHSYQQIDSPQEMLLLVDILRNEKPIWYHKGAKAIKTGKEKPGEEETGPQ